MTKTFALLAVAGAATFANAQTVLFAEGFEGASQYTSSTAEFSDGGGDFWFKTGGAFSTPSYYVVNGADGNFFNGMDLDGEGAGLPIVQTFDTFNIAGYSSLSFSIDLAEDDDGTNQDWDLPGGSDLDGDYVSFEYQIDGSGPWIEFGRIAAVTATSTNGYSNGEPLFNGVAVTDTFANFSVDLGGVTGSTLAIRVNWDLESGDEDLAIDNLTVTGVPTPASAGLLALGGLVASRRRRA